MTWFLSILELTRNEPSEAVHGVDRYDGNQSQSKLCSVDVAHRGESPRPHELKDGVRDHLCSQGK